MHLVFYFLLLASTASLAHYRGYETRNLIEREEPLINTEGELVECPVCKTSLSLIPNDEKCDVQMGNKWFKKCHRGTYVNEVCGNRWDCYRGPGDRCTEKMDYDVYGQKCASGYHCDGTLHICLGIGHTHNSRQRFLLNNILGYNAQQEQAAE